jgi:hypothetical protein
LKHQCAFGHDPDLVAGMTMSRDGIMWLYVQLHDTDWSLQVHFGGCKTVTVLLIVGAR